MNKARVLLFSSVVAGALVVGGIIGATASGVALLPVSAAIFAATSPTPTPAFKSNETPSHEAGESASREAAENSGTFHPGGPGAGPGGHPCGGHSNETSAHEKGETAAQETAENAPCPTTGASPSPTK